MLTMEASLEEQKEQELEALEAIYGTDFSTTASREGTVVHICLPEAGLRLTVHLPASYPAKEKPLFEVRAPKLLPKTISVLAEVLQSSAESNIGCSSIFTCVEALRERLQDLDLCASPNHCIPEEEAADDATGPASAPGSASSVASEDIVTMPAGNARVRTVDDSPFPHIVIARGEPVRDRRSTFIGHAARVRTEEEVKYVLNLLCSDSKLSRATHNMYAYRVTDANRGVQLHDNDDDGEAAAGGRMAALLDAMKVDDVIVVISRWFGGTLLGPIRFQHINNAARSALEACGCLNDPTRRGSGNGGGNRNANGSDAADGKKGEAAKGTRAGRGGKAKGAGSGANKRSQLKREVVT